jgi:hypothetical protein
MIKATKDLKSSLENTDKHVKSLHILGKKLENNINKQQSDLFIDTSLLRKRRELSDHKWSRSVKNMIK